MFVSLGTVVNVGFTPHTPIFTPSGVRTTTSRPPAHMACTTMRGASTQHVGGALHDPRPPPDRSWSTPKGPGNTTCIRTHHELQRCILPMRDSMTHKAKRKRNACTQRHQRPQQPLRAPYECLPIVCARGRLRWPSPPRLGRLEPPYLGARGGHTAHACLVSTWETPESECTAGVPDHDMMTD